MSHKQAAKRRWKATRDAKAQRIRDSRREYRATTVRVKTLMGTIHLRTHPLFRTYGVPDALPTQPGYYDLTRKAS